MAQVSSPFLAVAAQPTSMSQTRVSGILATYKLQVAPGMHPAPAACQTLLQVFPSVPENFQDEFNIIAGKKTVHMVATLVSQVVGMLQRLP